MADIKINLLPWREERRETKKKEFLNVIVGVIILGGTIVGGVDRFYNSLIDNQTDRNTFLTAEITTLEGRIAEIDQLQQKKNELLSRMKVIQELQGNRPIIVRVLDQLVRTVPDGVFYTALSTKDKRIYVAGVAESNNRVSSLMRRLDASDWLASPNLDKVKAATSYGDQANTFNLSVSVQAPVTNDPSEEG